MKTTRSFKKSVMLTSQARGDSSSPLPAASSSVTSRGPLALPSTSFSPSLTIPSSSHLSQQSYRPFYLHEREAMATTTTRSTTPSSSLLAAPLASQDQSFWSTLTVPFIGKPPVKTVVVPRAIIEPDPPTVRTAKTVMCSFKVCIFHFSFLFL